MRQVQFGDPAAAVFCLFGGLGVGSCDGAWARRLQHGMWGPPTAAGDRGQGHAVQRPAGSQAAGRRYTTMPSTSAVDKPVTVTAGDGVLGAVTMVNDDEGTPVAGQLSPDGLTWSHHRAARLQQALHAERAVAAASAVPPASR